MRDLALTAFFFALVPFVITRPHWGILMWTWLGLMTPQHLAFGFSRAIPFAQIVGLLTLFAIAIAPEKKRLPLSGLVAALFAFNVWMTFTTSISLFPDLAWSYWQLVMKIQLMGLLTILVMQSRDRITALVWVSTLSVAFFGIKGGAWTLMRGGSGMVEGPGTGFLGGNNALAVALAMTLPLMYWLYLQAERRWLRYGMIAAMVLTAIGTLGTTSRGGLLAIIGMGLWLWLKSRQKVAIALVLALLIPVVLSMLPESWYEKMDTIRTYEQNTSAMARINAWGFAWNLAQEKPLGGGFQVFQPEAFERWGPDATQYGLREDEWHDAHSIWFKILAEQGFVGLGLYVLIWFLAWRTASRIVRTTVDRPDLNWARDLAAMIQVSLIAYWVGGSFLSFAHWDYPLVLVAILIATREVVEGRGLPDDGKRAPLVPTQGLEIAEQRNSRTEATGTPVRRLGIGGG